MLPNITTHTALFVTIANIINIITNSWGTPHILTPLISIELTSPTVELNKMLMLLGVMLPHLS